MWPRKTGPGPKPRQRSQGWRGEGGQEESGSRTTAVRGKGLRTLEGHTGQDTRAAAGLVGRMSSAWGTVRGQVDQTLEGVVQRVCSSGETLQLDIRTQRFGVINVLITPGRRRSHPERRGRVGLDRRKGQYSGEP